MHTEHSKFRTASYILMAAALLVILHFRFLPLLLSIILTYIFINRTNGLILWMRHRLLPHNTFLHRSLNVRNINLVSATFTISLVLLAITLMALGVYRLIHSGHITVMLAKLAILNMLPENLAEIKAAAAELLTEYGATLTRISKNSFTSFVYVLIGVIIGALLSFHRLNTRRSRHQMLPFKVQLVRRITNFQTSFERVFIAQVKISLIDTAVTAVYLYLILPTFGVELPFRLTVLVIAFVVGLVPVAGNLVSNTVIIILSLGASLYVAAASLVFLVVVHKLEYFLNAKIIGSQIESSAWELLLVMVVFERIFGISGIIISPVYYAYLKNELKQAGLI